MMQRKTTINGKTLLTPSHGAPMGAPNALPQAISTITGRPQPTAQEEFQARSALFDHLGNSLNEILTQGAYMAPGSGEYLSARDALIGGQAAEQAFMQGNYLDAARKYGQSVVDSIGVIPGISMGTFAGKGALGASKTLLKKAMGMVGDAEKIRKETGWFKGMDNKWRFEVDDSKAIIDFGVKKGTPIKHGFKHKILEKDAPLNLSDVLKHDDLFDHYPELRDVAVSVRPMDKKGEWNGAVIWLNENLDSYHAEETLIHEIQHAIQQTEGFAKGGSSKDITLRFPHGQSRSPIEESLRVASRIHSTRKILKKQGVPYRDHPKEINKQLKDIYGYTQKEIDTGKTIERNMDINKIRFNLRQWAEIRGRENYRKLAGEIEARDAGNRLRLSKQGRKETPPRLREDAIIRSH